VSESDEHRRRKLGFRARHRGILEMDILFSVFVDEHLAALKPGELDIFEAILEESDPDLLSWISGATATPSRWNNSVMDQLKTIALKPDDYGS